MTIYLTPYLEEQVKLKVESGFYNSVSEVIREALRLLDERDYLQKRRLEALRKDIAAGVEQADNGDLIDGKTVFDALRQKMLT
jgi:antitoxin ParD1/3/4